MKITCPAFILSFLSFITIHPSCVTPRNSLNYFSEDSSALVEKLNNYDIRIKPGDKLSIAVTAPLNPASAQPYNLSTDGKTPVSYTVNSEGKILLPQLGEIKVEGLTKIALRDSLQHLLTKYISNPVVLIEFLNFKITVLGEVNRQGVVSVSDDRVTILEALGQAGDITIYGRKDNVVIIREQKGKREFGKVNLLSKNVFNSPYYFLQQNDVVYVEALKGKPTIDDQVFNKRITLITTAIAIISSLTLLVLNLIK